MLAEEIKDSETLSETCLLILNTGYSTQILQWSVLGWGLELEGRQGCFPCRSSQTACLISICWSLPEWLGWS